MSEASSEANPQILVNGRREQQDDDAAAGEEKEKDRAKMQSVFQQVREQIRSQAAPKSSLLELMQKVKDRELLNREPDGKEEKNKDDTVIEADLKQEELCEVFEKKLEESRKALREEFEAQITLARAEMQAYTDRALRDLENKFRILQLQDPHLQESRGARPRPSAPPQLASRRGRVLTRTMTTIIPKTCPPVILGPRAKSETITCSKCENPRPRPRDLALPPPGNRPGNNRPLLPPARPPLQQQQQQQQHRKPARPKAKPWS